MTDSPQPIQSRLLTTTRVRHGFFTRQGGVSTGIYASLNCGPGSADASEHVTANRQRVAHALESSLPLLTLYQVHSAHAVTVTTPFEDNARPRADALVTDRPGMAIGVLTADCAPVLLADADAGVIGAAHAGWKGALSGVIDATVQAMEGLGASRPRIKAAIGPAIAQNSYEVSDDFRGHFLTHDTAFDRYFAPGARPGHRQFDLEGFVRDRLGNAGIGAIDALGLDTYSAPRDFFSYRRTTHAREADYGRQVSAIMLSE